MHFCNLSHLHHLFFPKYIVSTFNGTKSKDAACETGTVLILFFVPQVQNSK